jgi:hypothetical protein
MVDSKGKKYRLFNIGHEGDPFTKRKAIAIRVGGENRVHTYRIPGIITTKKGTLIAVYDVRYDGSYDLPANIDVNATSFGLDYDWVKTDYRLNPRSGNEIRVITSVGIKNIKRNNDILSIKDPSFNYAGLYDSLKERSYQFRIKLAAAHYFPVGKQSTFKTALNAAVFNSQSVFRNELFQIGGYRLLRGFDEESIYATQYAVTTVEYRIRASLNSYFFGFVDGGIVKNKYQDINLNNNFISTGLGMALETKLGLLNVSYALGKRNDVKFNIREASKIHFGYVNYF